MLTVRKGAKEDLESVKRLEQELFPDKQSNAFAPENYLALWSPFFFVAEDEDFAGYAAGKLKDPATGWILALAVVPEYRRRGTGLILLHSLLDAFGKEKATSVFLHVRKSSIEAKNLYQKAGFTVTREVPKHYRDGETGLRMELRIS